MTSHADRGASLMAAKNYPLAIDSYTQALKTSLSPVWLIQRSTAYQRTNNHDASLKDAEASVIQGKERGKRDLIAQAQLRRGIALFRLGRIADARMVLIWVRMLNEKEKGLGLWVETVTKAYEALPEGDEGRKVTVEEWPDKRVVEEVKAQLEGREVAAEAAPTATSKQTPPSSPAAPAAEKTETIKAQPAQAKPAQASTSTPAVRSAIQPTPQDKIRQEWYQSSTSVSISILAKGIPKDSASVAILANKVTVSFPTPTEPYTFTLAPTYGAIDVEKSTYNITPHKLELTLKKEGGLKWAKLEGDADAPPQISSTPQAAAPSASTASHAPAYPTSSKHGTKDWDALAKQELKKARDEAAAKAGPSDKPVAEDDEDDESDPLHGFFKKIYAGADPDTKKAMMKSFVESNGTTLSTNWDEVSQGKVEGKVPEGYEEKKY